LISSIQRDLDGTFAIEDARDAPAPWKRMADFALFLSEVMALAGVTKGIIQGTHYRNGPRESDRNKATMSTSISTMTRRARRPPRLETSPDADVTQSLSFSATKVAVNLVAIAG
jgi:hypothetical protein